MGDSSGLGKAAGERTLLLRKARRGTCAEDDPLYGKREEGKGGLILEVDGVRLSYDGRPVLEGVEFKVSRGSMCAVLGNNGAGKTTLLKCVAAILPPRSGVVLIEGVGNHTISARELARRLGYVAQRQERVARLTVFDAVLLGRKPYLRWGVGGRDVEVVEKVLAAMGMRDLSLRFLDELSGGELQKVFIARALAQEPAVLLLDEPTNNLDLRNQLEVMSMVKREVRERGMAALVAIHDLNLALRFCDLFLMLKDGRIFACGGEEAVNPDSVRCTYGVEVVVREEGGRKVVIPVE